MEPYYDTIKKVLTDLGLNADECYNAEGKYWALRKGTADVFVSLFTLGEGEAAEWYVEIASPIMKLPSKNLLPFYRRLLEENAQWVGPRFSLRGDTVWLDITRELAGMNYDEFRRSLERVGNVADELDESLRTEFGEEEPAA